MNAHFVRWLALCSLAAGCGGSGGETPPPAVPVDMTRPSAPDGPPAGGDAFVLADAVRPVEDLGADVAPADLFPPSVPDGVVSDAAQDLGRSPPPAGPPNFVFILGEARGWTSTSVLQDEENPDSRSDLFDTPNLARVAAEGMTFSDFYAPSPRCMPSRASYFSGRSPAKLHMTFIPEGNRDGEVQGNVVPPQTVTDLPTDLPTVASLLKARGYATAHFGKWHAGQSDPARYGFDESDGPTSNRGPDGTTHPNPMEAYGTTERGRDFVSRQVAAGRPFYLQVSHYGGSEVQNALPETYAAESARLAGRREADIAEAAVVKDMDITIGSLLDHLETLGVADRTYVFFSADHGRAGAAANAPLNQGKGSVWEGGIRVPLIIRGPVVGRGLHAHVRASQVDLLPTVARLAGVDPLPEGLEGGDLRPVLESGTGRVERASDDFIVHFPHYDKDPLGPASAIISGDFKLIRFYEDGSQRLFDLSRDLGEATDLAAQMPEKVAELAGRLDAYLADVGAQLPGRR